MSDLAVAVFGGQLLGHLVSGEELTSSVISNAAITADLASGLIGDKELSATEHQILQAKIANHVIEDGNYCASSVIHDHIDAGSSADIADIWIN